MFSQQLKRLAGPALALGGLLWIIIYVIIVIIGLKTGKLAPSPGPNSPALVNSGIWFLPLSVLPLGLGLLGVFALLEGRARGLGITGVVFTSIAMIMAIIDLIVLSGFFVAHLNNLLGGGAAFATTIGTGFLGWAALSAHVLPRWMAWTLLIIGLVTIPILFATPLPIGPDWATDFLAFLVSGIAYTVVGVTLLAARKPADEHIGDANAAAQAK
jgi:hypothetical protein